MIDVYDHTRQFTPQGDFECRIRRLENILVAMTQEDMSTCCKLVSEIGDGRAAHATAYSSTPASGNPAPTCDSFAAAMASDAGPLVLCSMAVCHEAT